MTETATLDRPTAVEDLYPSRVEPEPRRLPRKDPVVHGAPGTGLDAEQRASYERKGFLAVSDLFDDAEVVAYQEEAERLRRLDGLAARDDVITEPGGNAVRSIFRPHEHSETIERLARHPRLLAMVEEILGGGAYLHQARINYKPGFRGKEFYWHSDFETWHVEDGMPRMRAVSCSIALTENTPFNGPLMLVPGSQNSFVTCVGETPEDHYKSSLKKQEYGVPAEAMLRELVAEGGIEAPVGPAGSVTLFDCNTMHGSASNISPMPRTNVFFVFNSVENRLVEPFSGQEPRPSFIAVRDHVPALRPAS